ncbi:MAG: hypothetical protein KIG95_06530, partial [Comamonas sp.]|nr:hypothetical protein [Comamonas sp.]
MIAGGSATQALPQQLLTVQAWPQSLLQAVLQQAGQPVGQQVEQQTGEQTGLSRPPGQALLPPMADTR